MFLKGSAPGACVARGVIEWAFEAGMYRLQSPGNFFAKTVLNNDLHSVSLPFEGGPICHASIGFQPSITVGAFFDGRMHESFFPLAEAGAQIRKIGTFAISGNCSFSARRGFGAGPDKPDS
ncbi:hypothetical protein [Labrenzia sp. THAF35]|uniref:hypothetical protein n=1 Tax=Labrenzia sp. THAF35 TaxID=2587854 RepID=UPI001566DD80|nr:hypothetical protein [Labrenzia sp. THAF35]